MVSGSCTQAYSHFFSLCASSFDNASFCTAQAGFTLFDAAGDIPWLWQVHVDTSARRVVDQASPAGPEFGQGRSSACGRALPAADTNCAQHTRVNNVRLLLFICSFWLSHIVAGVQSKYMIKTDPPKDSRCAPGDKLSVVNCSVTSSAFRPAISN